MSISALTSLTDLITGAFKDDLKTLFKVSTLVAAAIFVALNLTLVYPPLLDAGLQPAVAFAGLAPAWQIAVGTLGFFALSYVLHVLGGTFLSLASGAPLRTSPLLGRLLLALERSRYKRFRPPWTHQERGFRDDTERTEFQNIAAARLAYDFPSWAALAPTRLGNVLTSAAAYTWHKYGAHLNTLWPLVDMVLVKEDEKLLKQLSENQESLVFLTTLWALLGIVGLEVLVLRLVLGPPIYALWALVVWLAAYVIYGAAVQKGRDWGRNIRTAFDLYLDNVAEKLEFGALSKQQWEEVSTWLAYGGIEGKTQEHFDLVDPRDWPKPVQLQVKHPPTTSAKVELVTELKPDTFLRPDPNKRTWCLARSASYVCSVTNEETGEHAKAVPGAYLIVTDPRFSSLPSATVDGWRVIPGTAHPPGKAVEIKIKGERLPDSRSLFWDMGRLPPKSSHILRYEVEGEPYVRVSLDGTDFEVEAISHKRFPGEEGGLTTTIKLGRPDAGTAALSLKITVALPECKDLPQVAEYSVDSGDLEPAELWADPPKTVICTITSVPTTAKKVIVILAEKPEEND